MTNDTEKKRIYLILLQEKAEERESIERKIYIINNIYNLFNREAAALINC